MVDPGGVGVHGRTDSRNCGAHRTKDAGLEQTDTELRLTRFRAVGDLRVEVRIEVTVSDAPERGAPGLPGADSDSADAKQRHIVEDVLTAEQTQLAASENLRAIFEPDRHVYLTHVDLRPGLGAIAEVVVHGSVVDLRRKPEVDAEVQARFLASRRERRESGAQSRPNARAPRAPALHFREHPEGV